MKLTRRQATKLGLIGLGGISALSFASSDETQRKQGLKMLVLGGTGFLGPHIVRHALASGHTLTLFNRGEKDPNLFPDVERLLGDRAGKLDALKGRKWDVVIDTSTFFPNQVAMSTSLLGPNVGQYIFISSTAVYKDWTNPVMNDDSPVLSLKDPEAANFSSFQRYGAAKAACELEVQKAFPNKYTVIRSDAIAGPGDKGTYVYTSWVRRASQGGDILAPGKKSDFIQYIDARDLGEWIVHCAENSIRGTYTATSPGNSYTMENMIDDCQRATQNFSPVVWVDSDFLISQGVKEIPLWFPARDKEVGIGRFDISRAQKNGLKQRPKIETAKDVYEWFKGLPESTQNFAALLSESEERRLISDWKQARSGSESNTK